jgi:hypothetical protein
MQTSEGADERTQRELKGIIADLLVNFTSVVLSACDGPDAASSLFDLARTLSDARTLACESARRKRLGNNFLQPAISTRSFTTDNAVKWGRFKPSS